MPIHYARHIMDLKQSPLESFKFASERSTTHPASVLYCAGSCPRWYWPVRAPVLGHTHAGTGLCWYWAGLCKPRRGLSDEELLKVIQRGRETSGHTFTHARTRTHTLTRTHTHTPTHTHTHTHTHNTHYLYTSLPLPLTHTHTHR